MIKAFFITDGIEACCVGSLPEVYCTKKRYIQLLDRRLCQVVYVLPTDSDTNDPMRSYTREKKGVCHASIIDYGLMADYELNHLLRSFDVSISDDDAEA